MKKILTRTGQILAGTLAIPVILLGMLLTLSVHATPQETCPEGNGWVKKDGLTGLTYTFTEIPDGKEVVESCMKVGSHDPVYGTSATVTNSTLFNSPGNPPAVCTAVSVPHNGCALQNISHASFKLADKQGDPETCPEGTTNTGTAEQLNCVEDPTGCPYGDRIPVDSPKCAPPEEDVVEKSTPTPVETQETEVFYGK